MILYKILLFSSIAAAMVILYFFLVGLIDGSITARNGMIWSILLLAVAASLVGGTVLKRHGFITWSKLCLAVLAIPGWLYAFYLVLIVVTKPRWN